MNLKRCGTCGMITNDSCGSPKCAIENQEVPEFAKLELREAVDEVLSEYKTMSDKIKKHNDPVVEERKTTIMNASERIMKDHEKLFIKLAESEEKDKIVSKGTKYDSGKSPLSIIPREALEGCANAFGFGAKKYGRNNFKSGIEMNRLLDAAMRHLVAYASGESSDPESNLSHLDHALAALSMAKYMEINRPDLDDRYKDNKKEK